MKSRRFCSLLLAALLALSSFAFSATKAWAADTLPVFPDYVVISEDTVTVRYYTGPPGHPNPWSSSYPSVCSISAVHYMTSEISVPAGAYSIQQNFAWPYLSPGGRSWEYFFEFSCPDGVVPATVALQCRTAVSGGVYYLLPFDVQQYGNTYVARLTYDGSTPDINILGWYVFFSEPGGDWSYPLDKDFTGVPQSFNFQFSPIYSKVVSVPSQEDKYQNNVTSGISKVKDTVQKGFDKVTTAVKGIGSSISASITGSMEAVGEKVAELKESVVEKTTEIKESIIEKTDEVKETITQETEKLGNFLLDGIKDLFLPSETYFSELFDRLNQFFADRFGFLYFPIEHFISLCNKLLNLPETAPSIAIPELAYEGQVLIPAQTYTFDFLSQEPFKTVHDYYLLAIDAALISAFVALLHKKWEEVMAN